jgi:ABC-2 type transport system permease protein
MWYIARREYRSYFASPIAFGVLFLTFLILGYFFWYSIAYAVQSQGAFVPNANHTLGVLPSFLFLLTPPAITMRALAEENRQGTLELLLTSPVRDWELVVGKWLGSLFFFMTLLAITLIYPLVLNFWIVSPGIDQGSMIALYLGLFLFISAVCAVGVFMSSLFSNQIAALLLTWVVILMLVIISAPSQLVPGVGGELMRYLSISDHMSSFQSGAINLKDVVYYLSLTALGLFLGTVSVEARRWR